MAAKKQTPQQAAKAKQARAEAPIPEQGATAGALQMSDLSPVGRKVVHAQMRQAGLTMRERNADAQGRAAHIAVHGGTADSRNKGRVMADTHDLIAPHLRDRAITPASAANVRSKMYSRAIDSAHERGLTTPDGAGWYFNHHADIAAAAKATGHDVDRAITASAVMSPQNGPDNEKAAVGALMQAHAHGTVTLHPRVVAHLQNSGFEVHPAHVGQAVRASDLPPRALAALSGANIREHVEHTGFNLKDISRGGTKANIGAAEDVLTGRIPREQAPNMHPISAPKVNSYEGNIRESVPNTPVHDEYMFRVQHQHGIATGRVHPEQTYADVHGLSGSKEGVLSPTRNTAEDTWMNSMTFNQPNVTPAKKTNVFKAGGSNNNYGSGVISKKATVDGEVRSAHTRAEVGPTALLHAFNNKATIDAARKQSFGGHREVAPGVHVGVNLPAVAMQEVAWTQARRETGKDKDWNDAQKAAPSPTQRAMQIRGQGRLF